MIVLFDGLLYSERIAYVADGGVALEQWNKSYNFAKLYDADQGRLQATARRLGVRVIKIGHPGTKHQHIDLVGEPLAKALAEAITYGEAING